LLEPKSKFAASRNPNRILGYDYQMLDATSWKLLEALQKNARTSFADLGRLTGLTPPAVAERVRRLEDMGYIRGYAAQVDAGRLGLPMTVIIGLQTESSKYEPLKKFFANEPEILEVHHVTGAESLMIKAAVADVPALESLIGRLSHYGSTRTSLVLSTLFSKRIWSEAPLKPGLRRLPGSSGS
jgi:Lrp/AsnC family leucine-responsive transcriptional regulator